MAERTGEGGLPAFIGWFEDLFKGNDTQQRAQVRPSEVKAGNESRSQDHTPRALKAQETKPNIRSRLPKTHRRSSNADRR
mmetsp:Transcript_54163/g.142602  ORF Transcript_54163/g.142602 Transcript_54163/m.142602 type:complete len:80 (+) Transcript_54163:84-323(+)